MKEKKFKKITYIMAILIFSILSVNVFATEEYDTLEESLRYEFGENYEEYLQDNYYQTEVAQKVENLIKQYYGETYPDYYGGIYITDDSKNLVVQIVKKNIPDKNKDEYKIYRELISVDNSILVEFVDYSFNQLLKTQEIISDNYIRTDNFSSMGIDVIKNRVSIGLVDNSFEMQDEFKKSSSRANACIKGKTYNNNNLDFDMVEFKKEGIKNASLSLSLKPGEKIVGNPGSCSMGFRTKYNGKAGYVTAGHCVATDRLDTILPTGSVKLYQFYDNQAYDYAFVESNGKFNLSNDLMYNKSSLFTVSLIASNANPATPVGTAIAKVGYASKYTSGKITALNQTVYYGNTGKTIKGLVDSNLYSTSGDSGGPIFIVKSNTTALPIGILSGSYNGTTQFTSINSLPYALLNGRY